MFRKAMANLRKTTLMLTVMTLFVGGFIFVSSADAFYSDSDYSYWKSVGRKAAVKAIRMLEEEVAWLSSKDLVALTNAGYAQIYGEETMGALDGLSQTLGVSRGDNSLVEVHSAAEKALWFAIFHKRSGYCAYLQVDPESLDSGFFWGWMMRKSIFSIAVVERIDADYLFDNVDESIEKIGNKMFGGNEFRVVTICNALAEGAPSYAIRSFELHDHYCPGVTSGIFMARYMWDYYPVEDGNSYFVHSVQPWCKEDALICMLNTTPGKRGYAVSYPTAEDMAKWPSWASNVSTIIYRQDTDTGNWVAFMLGFTWADTGCPEYGNSLLNKLCMDLYYLDRLDQPEVFVSVIKEIALPDGAVPKDYARPGMDTVVELGALVASGQ